jgi:hypothetical protein
LKKDVLEDLNLAAQDLNLSLYEEVRRETSTGPQAVAFD